MLINLRDIPPRGSDARSLIMQGHILAGLVVLALVLPCLMHRFRNASPPTTPPIASWENILSRCTHIGLYAFLVVQPVLGLLTVFAGGRGIVLPFTSLHIPSPITADKALSEQLGNIHG